MPTPALLAEFLLLFVVLPLAFRFSPFPVPPLPLLWLATLYCFLILRRDPAFPRHNLWNAASIPAHLPGVLALFAVLASLILLGTRLAAPELLFGLIRRHPMLWAAIMILYPILSVYPQGLVYRAFLMHRYAGLVAHNQLLLILLSAAAFGFLHIIFRNPLAIGMTFFGGLLFAWRYHATQSLALSSLEHALYGCLLFTVGLGQYFYHGRARLDDRSTLARELYL